jgi:membrane protein YqaA with SNARE-associated domain
VGTAEISVIISAVAVLGSLSGAVITYRLGLSRFGHERSLADRADARSTLADAALELYRSTEALNSLRCA